MIVRNRVNMAAGLAIQVILLGIWILNDPLEYRGPLPPGDSASWAESVIMALVMGGLGVAAMGVFWYPHVRIENESVMLYNPFSTVTLHKSAIAEIDTRTRHVRIRAADRWFRCWGLETSLWMQLTDNDKAWRSQFEPLVRVTGPDGSSAGEPSRQWRRPTRPEVVVGIGWLALLIVSMIYG